MFPTDFKELLYVFNVRQIRYLLVGGYAVSLHAQPRATKDLDLLISPDSENVKALYDALAEFGAPLDGVKADDFMEPDTFFRMGAPGRRFCGGLGTARRNCHRLGCGLTAPVISRSDLIAAKLASARPQDLADVAALRRTEQF